MYRYRYMIYHIIKYYFLIIYEYSNHNILNIPGIIKQLKLQYRIYNVN